jgi:transcriptional regulator with XRE-family HTH domain
MPNDQVRALGQRIREARYKAKLTLEKIGNHFGTAKQTVQQWETGQVLLN